MIPTVFKVNSQFQRKLSADQIKLPPSSSSLIPGKRLARPKISTKIIGAFWIPSIIKKLLLLLHSDRVQLRKSGHKI
ncbi:hypothetical protein PSHT_04023 [Puccinia striiformis]|uniref:Uncharacterized protein n=1 Tax=Puccinia striiformis TaxID=27350 RepID=A0A2S4WDT8_9BASI|nr:hypothetical protein PSHT_04023 [Puccinia striiformis]